MPLGFKRSAVAVSGTDVQVFSETLRGIGPCRLTVKNAGPNPLTGAKVQHLPEVGGPAVSIDTTTFATLAAGAAAQLAVADPVEVLQLLATCVAGTSLDIWLNTPIPD